MRSIFLDFHCLKGRAHLEAQAVLTAFDKTCFAQAEGQAFETPEELLQAVDLYKLTQKTFRDELQVLAGLHNVQLHVPCIN